MVKGCMQGLGERAGAIQSQLPSQSNTFFKNTVYIHWSICYIHPSFIIICLSLYRLCQSIHASIHPFIYQPIYLSIDEWWIYTYIHLVHLSIHPSNHASIHASIIHPSIHPWMNGVHLSRFIEADSGLYTLHMVCTELSKMELFSFIH